MGGKIIAFFTQSSNLIFRKLWLKKKKWNDNIVYCLMHKRTLYFAFLSHVAAVEKQDNDFLLGGVQEYRKGGKGVWSLTPDNHFSHPVVSKAIVAVNDNFVDYFVCRTGTTHWFWIHLWINEQKSKIKLTSNGGKKIDKLKSSKVKNQPNSSRGGQRYFSSWKRTIFLGSWENPPDILHFKTIITENYHFFSSWKWNSYMSSFGLILKVFILV